MQVELVAMTTNLTIAKDRTWCYVHEIVVQKYHLIWTRNLSYIFLEVYDFRLITLQTA